MTGKKKYTEKEQFSNNNVSDGKTETHVSVNFADQIPMKSPDRVKAFATAWRYSEGRQCPRRMVGVGQMGRLSFLDICLLQLQKFKYFNAHCKK